MIRSLLQALPKNERPAIDLPPLVKRVSQRKISTGPGILYVRATHWIRLLAARCRCLPTPWGLLSQKHQQKHVFSEQDTFLSVAPTCFGHALIMVWFDPPWWKKGSHQCPPGERSLFPCRIILLYVCIQLYECNVSANHQVFSRLWLLKQSNVYLCSMCRRSVHNCVGFVPQSSSIGLQSCLLLYVFTGSMVPPW